MKIVCSVSVKGGVGKTTVATNLSKSLVRMGYKTGLLDADVTGPDVAVALGCESKSPMRGKGSTIIPVEHNGLKVLSWSMVFPPDSAVMIEDSQIYAEDVFHIINMVNSAILSEDEKTVILRKDGFRAAMRDLKEMADTPGGTVNMLKQLFDPGVIDWGNLDYLVVDTPPTSAGITRAVIESGIWGGILVTQPSRPSFADLRRTVDMFRKKQVPVIGLISNQGTHNGAQRYDLTDSDIQLYAGKCGIPFIAAIPHTNDLQPYFDKLAEFVVNSKPIVLQKAVSKAPEVVSSISKLADLFKEL